MYHQSKAVSSLRHDGISSCVKEAKSGQYQSWGSRTLSQGGPSSIPPVVRDVANSGLEGGAGGIKMITAYSSKRS